MQRAFQIHIVSWKIGDFFDEIFFLIAYEHIIGQQLVSIAHRQRDGAQVPDIRAGTILEPFQQFA